MNKIEIKAKIIKSIEDNQEVKIYFRDTERSPMVGHFVEIKDHEDLLKKGFIRFSSRSKYEDFVKTGHVMYTRIHSLNSYFYIKDTIKNEQTKICTAKSF